MTTTPLLKYNLKQKEVSMSNNSIPTQEGVKSILLYNHNVSSASQPLNIMKVLVSLWTAIHANTTRCAVFPSHNSMLEQNYNFRGKLVKIIVETIFNK